MSKEVLEELKEALFSELDVIRSKYEDPIIEKIKEQYIGKYIKFDNNYIYCYEIFRSYTYLVFRGIGFSFNNPEYIEDAYDNVYFNCSSITDINLLEDDLKDIQIISKEKYYKVLQEHVKSIKEKVDELIMKELKHY
jgi:hypothetical protein